MLFSEQRWPSRLFALCSRAVLDLSSLVTHPLTIQSQPGSVVLLPLLPLQPPNSNPSALTDLRPYDPTTPIDQPASVQRRRDSIASLQDH